MRKTLLLLFILIVLISCRHVRINPEGDQPLAMKTISHDCAPKNINPILEEDNKDKPFRVTISSGINSNSDIFNFTFISDTKGHVLRKIIILKNNKPFQSIHTKKDVLDKEFKLLDWNFDGYKDICVLYNCGSGGCAYWIWNYSKSKNKFVYNKQLSEILGLEMDSVSKYIVFHYRCGYESEYWDTMKYVNNKLVFIKGLYRERGANWAFFTRKKMVNNKVVTTYDSCLIKDMEPEKPDPRFVIKEKSIYQTK